MIDKTNDASEPPLDCLVGRDVTRWTGAVTQHECGGFVAYGDFLELQIEIERLRNFAERMTRQQIEPYFALLAREALTPNGQS